MAHFYGRLKGARGEATRCGHKSSGLYIAAASWQGSVRVTLYERDGIDYATVYLDPWQGIGTHRVLYEGPVAG